MLTIEVQKRNAILVSKLSGSVTKALKDRTRQLVADKVNTVPYGKPRTAGVKKKMSNLKSEFKNKENAHRKDMGKTGGGLKRI